MRERISKVCEWMNQREREREGEGEGGNWKRDIVGGVMDDW